MDIRHMIFFNNMFFWGVVVLIVTFTIPCESQYRFKGSAVLGFTASQIDGDQLAGYNKLGISGGMKVAVDLNDRFEANLEMLYSQRGSQNRIVFGQATDIQRTHLDYLEIPVYASVKDWYIENEDYYKIRGHLGLSYAYLFNVSSSNGLFDGNTGDFKTNDISVLAGASYSLSSRWTATVRYTHSFVKMYKNLNLTRDGLISYFWTFRMDFAL